MAISENSADTRIRERLFVMWEEAGGDPEAAYHLWHKMRPMLMEKGARAQSEIAPAARRSSRTAKQH
jgi:hypothetical protein